MLTEEERSRLVSRVQILEARDVMSRVTAVEKKTFRTFGGLENIRSINALVARTAPSHGKEPTEEYVRAGMTAVVSAARRAELRRDISFLVPGLLEYTFYLTHAPTYFSTRHITKEDVGRLNAFYDEKEDGLVRRGAFVGLRAIDFSTFKETRRFRRLPTLDYVDALFQLVDEFLTNGTLNDDEFVEYASSVQKRLYKHVRELERLTNVEAFSLPKTDVVFFVTR